MRERLTVTVDAEKAGYQFSHAGHESRRLLLSSCNGERFVYDTFSTAWIVGETYRISCVVQRFGHGSFISRPRVLK